MDMNLSKLQFEQRVGHNLATEQQQLHGCYSWNSGLSTLYVIICFTLSKLQWSRYHYCPSLLQFSSVSQLCPTLWDSMDCSTPGFPLHHQLTELALSSPYRWATEAQTGEKTRQTAHVGYTAEPWFHPRQFGPRTQEPHLLCALSGGRMREGVGGPGEKLHPLHAWRGSKWHPGQHIMCIQLCGWPDPLCLSGSMPSSWAKGSGGGGGGGRGKSLHWTELVWFGQRGRTAPARPMLDPSITKSDLCKHGQNSSLP